jgi:hypothetical protein
MNIRLVVAVEEGKRRDGKVVFGFELTWLDFGVFIC